MELTHTFSVPTSVDDTWERFKDVGALAECFPGAKVTESDDTSFSGTCKVKLGPIALVYAGSGEFVERDESIYRFVVDAKGRDKRGNGTAGAVATVQMADDGGRTRVDVHTDLTITGKPAQFGRGLIQDVSDKLLAQFVDCLEQRMSPPEAAAEADDATGAVEAPAAPRAEPPPDDALDLGTTVLPVLVKNYWQPAAAGLGVFVLLIWLLRRRPRRSE